MNEFASYSFFNAKSKTEAVQVIEVNNNSNAEGCIDISIQQLQSYVITATLFKLLTPTNNESRYFKTANDLYTTENTFYSHSLLDNNNLRIYWIVDIGSLDVEQNDFYCLTFWINKDLTASSVKCCVSVILKVKNAFKD